MGRFTGFPIRAEFCQALVADDALITQRLLSVEEYSVWPFLNRPNSWRRSSKTSIICANWVSAALWKNFSPKGTEGHTMFLGIDCGTQGTKGAGA
ncbi:hypothetical protein HBB04_00001 [Pseudomonas coronafaciens]|nr:hypothetical protein HBB04_00001 [Pseudomonas coronafaciens]